MHFWSYISFRNFMFSCELSVEFSSLRMMLEGTCLGQTKDCFRKDLADAFLCTGKAVFSLVFLYQQRKQLCMHGNFVYITPQLVLGCTSAFSEMGYSDDCLITCFLGLLS